MVVDWFTVVAQAINFLVLVWLLKRFLYQPILKALDARERRIGAELAAADAKQAEAVAMREEYQRRSADLTQRRDTMLNEATEAATAERQRLLDAARKEAGDLRAKWLESLGREYTGLHDELAHRTQAEVFAVSRKVLTDLADESLEERMTEVFVRRLRGLSSDQKDLLSKMSQSPFQPVQIRSAFELPAAQRTAIEDAIREVFTAAVSVRFEIVTGLISGIELVVQGRKVAWSIGDYIASLERDVKETLKTKRVLE